mgnify:CR=1
MTTVINTPPSTESTGSGFVIGVAFVIIVLLGIFFVYGLPAIKNTSPNTIDVNLTLPEKTP